MQKHEKPFHFSSDSSCEHEIAFEDAVLAIAFYIYTVATLKRAGNEDDGER